MTIAVRARNGSVSVAEVNLKFIWDEVSQIRVGEHGQAYVVDARGRLIAHPDISLVLRNTDLSNLAQVQAARANSAGSESTWPYREAPIFYGRSRFLSSSASTSGLGEGRSREPPRRGWPSLPRECVASPFPSARPNATT